LLHSRASTLPAGLHYAKGGPSASARNTAACPDVIENGGSTRGDVMMQLAPLLLAGQLMTISDQPPQLNAEPSCMAAERAGLNGRTRDVCMNEENGAKSSLGEKWGQFSSAQQARCSTLVRMGGSPSYVELLTCLEMAEQANKIPDGDSMRGVGTMGSALREEKAR
jgi:hypothetical protein